MNTVLTRIAGGGLPLFLFEMSWSVELTERRHKAQLRKMHKRIEHRMTACHQHDASFGNNPLHFGSFFISNTSQVPIMAGICTISDEGMDFHHTNSHYGQSNPPSKIERNARVSPPDPLHYVPCAEKQRPSVITMPSPSLYTSKRAAIHFGPPLFPKNIRQWITG